MNGRIALIAGATVLGLIIGGCTFLSNDESDVGTVSVVGRWNLVGVSADGVETPVEVDVNAAVQPFVVFAGGANGNAGCNRFAATATPAYDVDGDTVCLNEVNQTAQYCGERSEIETWVSPFLFSDGFTVRTSTEVDEVVMRWISPNATLRWVRVSR